MRGGFQGHWLNVDAPKGEISLDKGPVREIDTTDDDFLLETENGETVYVDLTGLKPEFVGEVPVGTFGYVSQVLKIRFLFQ